MNTYQQNNNNQYQYQNYQNSGNQYEQEEKFEGLSKNSRLNFIKKVFGILSVQLSFTAFIVILVRQFKLNIGQNNEGFVLLAAFLNIGTVLLLSFKKNLSKEYPKNYVLLGVFTLTKAILVAIITQPVSTNILIQATVLTALVTISLTVYALRCKKDFTYMGGTLFLVTSSMLGIALMNVFFFKSPVIYSLYTFFGLLLYGYYLIYDVQLICGDRRRQISLDDYIMGSIALYTDVIQLFLKIVKILQKIQGEERKEKRRR